MKEVTSIKDITDTKYLLKFGQEFCIPCEITENNLKEIENDFDFPFYSTKNVDEAVERGYKNLPVVVIYNDGNWTEMNDSIILMSKEELRKWISGNNDLSDAMLLNEGEK